MTNWYLPGETSFTANWMRFQNPEKSLTLKRSVKGLEATLTSSSIPEIEFPTATTKIFTPLAFSALAFGMVKSERMFDLPSVTRKTHLLCGNDRRPFKRKNRRKAFTTQTQCREAIQNKANVFFLQLPHVLLLKVIEIHSEKCKACRQSTSNYALF